MAENAEQDHAHLMLAEGAVRREADGTPRLVGSFCGACGTKVFPPVHVCPECMSEDVHETDLSTEGSLYSWSVVHVAPANWKTPYIAGYVDLADGVRVFAHVTGADAQTLEMDMPVKLTMAILGDDDGVPVESYAFTPRAD